jgi:hypothetical protein
MRYLLTIMIISLLSCKKDSVNDTPLATPPTVTKVEVSSEAINGVSRPKFTITLDVPDPANVVQLDVFQSANFPASKSGRIVTPKTGQYIVIDSNATYPPSTTVKYFAFFTMKDYSYVSYYSFEVK